MLVVYDCFGYQGSQEDNSLVTNLKIHYGSLLCKTNFEIFSGISSDESLQFQMKNIHRNHFHTTFEPRGVLDPSESY